ncbi:MAG: restriction endonuclease subunit S [Chloroflexi bacterium]|nr:restriction endonuclease subunit S [Chloroflexota bacterium]
MEKIRKIRGVRWIPGLKNWFLRKPCWIGQALIAKDQYGATIKHLEPHHIASVPIPLVDEETQQKIHKQILKAYDLRDQANNLPDEADELLHKELGLSIFDDKFVPYLPEPKQKTTNRPSIPHPQAFTASAHELNDRFDGSYHVPTAKTAISLMKDGKYKLTLLENLVKDIIVAPRFKRIYVAKEYGIPFLQGSHLPQMYPADLKYLSLSQQANIERWIVEKGWVLVTCSGTIGRIGLVSSRRDKWAASQHILRILPDHLKGHPGYIAAFLSTLYGQHQILSKTYGGVIDEITAKDTGKIWIPGTPIKIQEKIGGLVVSAYEKKDEASEVEENAIRQIETILQK